MIPIIPQPTAFYNQHSVSENGFEFSLIVNKLDFNANSWKSKYELSCMNEIKYAIFYNGFAKINNINDYDENKLIVDFTVIGNKKFNYDKWTEKHSGQKYLFISYTFKGLLDKLNLCNSTDLVNVQDV